MPPRNNYLEPCDRPPPEPKNWFTEDNGLNVAILLVGIAFLIGFAIYNASLPPRYKAFQKADAAFENARLPPNPNGE